MPRLARLTTPLALVLAAVLSVAASPALAAKGEGCRLPKGAKSLAHNDRAVFYSVPKAKFHVYFGCDKGAGERYRIADDEDFETHDYDLGQFHLAGRYLAVVFHEASQYGEVSGLTEFDLKRRKAIYSYGDSAAQDLSARRFTDVVLSPSGKMAWISEPPHGYTVPPISVYEVATKGRLRALNFTSRSLDEGSDIAPGSLSLTGSRLSWQRGGVARSAQL